MIDRTDGQLLSFSGEVTILTSALLGTDKSVVLGCILMSMLFLERVLNLGLDMVAMHEAVPLSAVGSKDLTFSVSNMELLFYCTKLSSLQTILLEQLSDMLSVVFSYWSFEWTGSDGMSVFTTSFSSLTASVTTMSILSIGSFSGDSYCIFRALNVGWASASCSLSSSFKSSSSVDIIPWSILIPWLIELRLIRPSAQRLRRLSIQLSKCKFRDLIPSSALRETTQQWFLRHTITVFPLLTMSSACLRSQLSIFI